MKKITADRIQVVLKITERCNINCSYCYMFNLGNEDYKTHSAYISESTTQDIANFLRQGAIDLQAKSVEIILHGGEPLMLKPARFRKMCGIFKETISDVAELIFFLQTNAMMINDGWIDLFEEFNIHTGVSLDGPEDYHDEQRVDHAGGGTHAQTLVGLDLLQKAAAAGRISKPGGLVVINPKHSGKRIYRHMFDELKFSWVNFLVPMVTIDDFEPGDDVLLGNYFIEVLQEFILDNRTDIRVKFINEFLRFLVGGAPFERARQEFAREYAVISVSSDGHIYHDDEFKQLNIYPEDIKVTDTSLVEFLNSDVAQYFNQVVNTVPHDCRSCCWQNHCRGGSGEYATVTRYSQASGFDNKSVFCSALRRFYTAAAQHLIANGLDKTKMLEALEVTEEDYSGRFPRPPARLRRTIPLMVTA